MRCPFCSGADTGVKDSRPGEDNTTIRRRRFCSACSSRFTTVERVQLRELTVVKKSGHCELFDQEKLMGSLQRALHKRPVEGSRLERVVSSLVRQLETSGESMILSSVIGVQAMEVLLDLDKVAYVRFASIYNDFHSTEDFLQFIKQLDGSPKSE